MNQTLLGIIYLIAFSHALMLCISTWRRSQPQAPGRMMALMLAVLSYKLLEGGLLYSGLFVYAVHLLDLLPGEVLYIGPLCLFYVQRMRTDDTRFSRHVHWLHFIPAALLWAYNAPSVFRGSDAKIVMWQNILQNDGVATLPLVFIALLLAIKIHLGVYLFLSWQSIARVSNTASQTRSDNTAIVLSLMRNVVLAFALLEATWVGLFILQQAFAVGTLGLVSDIWLLLVAACVLAMGYVGLQQPNLIFSHEECALASTKEQTAPPNSDDNVKYFHSALPESTAHTLAKELEQQLQDKQLYLNEQLSLTDLAKATGIKSHLLSQIISQSMQTNFYRLINSYRIQHACDLIEDKKLHWSLERIAHESGFNNRVTFSKAFKEQMQCTPSAYRKNIAQAS